MNIREAQEVLVAAGLYDGSLDGDIGPKTRSAVLKSERTSPQTAWPWNRRVIGSGQRELLRLGFAPGPVDGFPGHKTTKAFLNFRAREKDAPAKPAPVSPPVITAPVSPPVITAPVSPPVITAPVSPPVITAPVSPPVITATATRFSAPRATTTDMTRVFGAPGGPRCSAGKAQFPFPFKLSFGSQTVTRFSCHELLAPAFTSLFREAAAHYGEDEFRRLRLDVFGGCYNPRRKRGGTSWSMHAWGAAVDLDPDNNQLKWGKPRAKFSAPEYEPFWKIVEAHGATSLGRRKNYDWMHFQFANE